MPRKFFAELPEECMYLLCHIFPNTFINTKKFFLFGQSSQYLKHALGREGAASLPARDFRCSLWNILGILSNGDITFCCLDYEGRLSCGNINDMTLTEALGSARRKTLVEHPDRYAICRGCKGTWA